MWLVLLAASLAADWLTLAGTEEGRDDTPVTVFGFAQPQFDAMVFGDTVNGERPAFNLVGGAPSSFQLRRARIAVRGSIPNTDQRVTYFMMTEAGTVSLARDRAVVFSDASVTLSAPGVRLRTGMFKLPAMEETVQGVATSMEFIHFSRTLTGLMLENHVGSDGQYDGPSFGFRDIGIQAFKGFQSEHWAGAYAVMLSNGNGVHAIDNDAAKDVTVRGEVAWVIEGERTSARRRELKLGGWWQEGTRAQDDDRYRRARRGLFLHLEQQRYWGLVELAQGVGMLEAGRSTPFASGDVLIAPEGRGWGMVAQTGVRLDVGDGSLGLKARFDRFHRRTDTPAALRIFQTTTAGVEYAPVRKVRLQVNYEFRDLLAPEGSDEAQAVAQTMADRVTAQVTALF